MFNIAEELCVPFYKFVYLPRVEKVYHFAQGDESLIDNGGVLLQCIRIERHYILAKTTVSIKAFNNPHLFIVILPIRKYLKYEPLIAVSERHYH